jgi:hypothetical protein
MASRPWPRSVRGSGFRLPQDGHKTHPSASGVPQWGQYRPGGRGGGGGTGAGLVRIHRRLLPGRFKLTTRNDQTRRRSR